MLFSAKTFRICYEKSKNSLPYYTEINDFLASKPWPSRSNNQDFFRLRLKPVQRFLGKISKMESLPPEEEFVGMLKEAMLLNEQGIKVRQEKRVTDKPKVLDTPSYFQDALDSDPKAKGAFESKSNSFRKEYIISISDARTDETRQKRITEALARIAEGKGRFWKHQK